MKEYVFLYLYFFIGAIFFDPQNIQTPGIFSLVPGNEMDALAIIEELLSGRETKIAIRNKGIFEILIFENDGKFIQYLKEKYILHVYRASYFPIRESNLFSTLPPKYPLIVSDSLFFDFLRYSVVGDTMIIETRLHKPRIFDHFLLGKKKFSVIYDVNIHIPFLIRHYFTHGSLQELVLENGYLLTLASDEILSLIWGDGIRISGTFKRGKKLDLKGRGY